MQYEATSNGLLVPTSKILGHGQYSGQIIRDGKVIDEWFDDPNLVVNEGLNSLLSVYLAAGTQITTWYLGVFEGNYTPVATDTAANIASNATESSAYSAGVRQTWTPGAVSSQTVTNSASKATFTFNATKTIYGAFLASTSTVGGTGGTLFSAARFSAPKSVTSGDQLLLTYSFTSSSV